MKLLLLIIGLATVGALSIFGPDTFGTMKEARGADRFVDAVFEAKRGDLAVTVSENGYLKAENSESLQPKYQGQNTITSLIDEGEFVEEGDTLVEFDATDLENDLEEAKNRLIQYEAEFEAAEANLAIQVRENEAATEKADLGLEVARLTLKRYLEGERPNTLRKNALAVEKAESEFKRSTEAYEQVPELLAEGFLTSIAAEEEKFRLREAEINVENAKQDLKIYETLTSPMELKQKESGVRDAERENETAQERANIRIKEKEARVSQNRRHVDSTKSRIEEIERNLGYMKLIAPRPGVVLYGDPNNRWMVNEIKVGNTIWPGMTVITLPDLSTMQVLLDVHEADIDLLEPGQKCTITIDTYKGKIFAGEVTDVASVATSSGWGDATNKKFRVELSMDNVEDIELRAGVTAKVEIQIELLEDVLHIPIHAVHKDGDAFVCFSPSPTGFARHVITLGKSNDNYVVIESGLEAGDRVILFDPREEGAEEDDEEESQGLVPPSTGEDEA